MVTHATQCKHGLTAVLTGATPDGLRAKREVSAASQRQLVLLPKKQIISADEFSHRAILRLDYCTPEQRQATKISTNMKYWRQFSDVPVPDVFKANLKIPVLLILRKGCSISLLYGLSNYLRVQSRVIADRLSLNEDSNSPHNSFCAL